MLRFIRELAEYERLLHAVTNTEADIHALLFGAPPAAFCDIAELDGKPVGLRLLVLQRLDLRGRGIHLEDLYVDPAARGAGVGKALLARLAKRCVDEKLVRLEWQVLDWNAPAIAFYDSLRRRDEERVDHAPADR